MPSRRSLNLVEVVVINTSVQMIERFYGKFPTYSAKEEASLNRGMQKGS